MALGESKPGLEMRWVGGERQRDRETETETETETEVEIEMMCKSRCSSPLEAQTP